MVEFFQRRKLLLALLVVSLVTIVISIVLIFFQGGSFTAQVDQPKPSTPNFNNEISQVDKLSTEFLTLARTYVSATATDKPSIETSLKKIAQERLDILTTLAKSDVQDRALVNDSSPTNSGVSTARELIMPADLQNSLRTTLPTTVTSLFEKNVSLDGTLTVSVGDNFKDGKAYYDYYLGSMPEVDLNKQARLILELADTNLMTGDIVKVSGTDLGGKFTLVFGKSQDELNTQLTMVKAARPDLAAPDVSTAGVSVQASETRKVAVIMVTFANQTEAFPFTTDQMRQSFFTDSQSVREYYKAVSQGGQLLVGRDRADGDFFGPYRMNLNKPLNSNQCDLGPIITYANLAATSAGANISGYRHTVYVFPYFQEMSACGKTGQAYINGRSAWVVADPTAPSPLKVLSSYVLHELGHNFGMGHAHSYKCFEYVRPDVEVVYRPPNLTTVGCQDIEYGDDYDVMGGGSVTQGNDRLFEKGYRHSFFMNTKRIQYDWLSKATKQTVDQSGQYTLLPANTREDGGIRTLGIPGNNRIYTLEYRVDSPVERIPPDVSPSMQIIVRENSSASASHLIRTAPYSSYSASAYGKALPVGQTFELANYFKIKNVAANATSATVEVTLLNQSNPSTCLVRTPEVSYTSVYRSFSQPFDIHTLKVRNRDLGSRCTASTYTLSLVGLFTGWVGGFQNGTTRSTTVTIAAGQSANVPLQITSTNNAMPGRYQIGINTFRNTQGNLERTNWIINHWRW